MLAELREDCPGLAYSNLAVWRRIGALVEGNDYRVLEGGPDKPETDAEVRKSFRFSFEAVEKIARLYHYDVQRKFVPGQYRDAASRNAYNIFIVTLEQLGEPVRGRLIPWNAIRDFAEISEASHGIFEVQHAAAVLGGEVSFIATCRAVDAEDLSTYVGKLIDRIQLDYGTISVTRYAARPGLVYTRQRNNVGEDPRVQAFVLMSLTQRDVPSLERILEKVRAIPGVTSAAAVFGDVDLIFTVEVASLEELSVVIVGGLRNEYEVTATRTYLAVPGYEFRTDDEKMRRKGGEPMQATS